MYSRFLVLLQFVFMILIVYPLFGSQALMWGSIAVVLGGLLGVWTLAHNRLGNFNIVPEVRSNCQLITSGPYHYMRNPMYSSLLLVMLGVVIYHGNVNQMAFWLGLMVVLAMKVKREEICLALEFPEYQDYASRVKRFIPGVY